MSSFWRIRKVNKSDSSRQGYYLQPLYPLGFIFDFNPQWECDQLNRESNDWNYSVETTKFKPMDNKPVKNLNPKQGKLL